ncbi:MAG: hypothetical protein R2839_12605 [Thermomicrobiales bacterium]
MATLAVASSGRSTVGPGKSLRGTTVPVTSIRAHSQYLYFFDIAREDRNTGGQPVYAPVSGTVRWTERESGGITINMGNGYAVAMFHVTVDRGWEMGDPIE